MKILQRIAGYSLLASSVMFANASFGEGEGLDSVLEEVTVTGSYFKGSPSDAPSPVQVIDRDAILESGALLTSDIIKNLNINSGSTTNLNEASENASIAGKGNVNLRGLGISSTLVLINGKRQTVAAARTQRGETFVDINEIPAVMLQRVEVLKDGGSATYGSDAIAGVVNFITRDDFVGFELTGSYQETDDSSQDDQTIGGIFGWESADSKTHIVFGADYLDRSSLPLLDKDYATFNQVSNTDQIGAIINQDIASQTGAVGQASLLAGAFAALVLDPALGGAGLGSEIAGGLPAAFGILGALDPSTLRNPAFDNTALSAAREAAGLGPSNLQTDPGCTAAGGFTGTATDPFEVACRADTREFGEYISDTTRLNTMLTFSHEFNAAAEVYGEVLYSKTEIERPIDGTLSHIGGRHLVLSPASTTLAAFNDAKGAIDGLLNSTNPVTAGTAAFVIGSLEAAVGLPPGGFAASTPGLGDFFYLGGFNGLTQDYANAPNQVANGGYGGIAALDFNVNEIGSGSDTKNESETQRFLLGMKGEFEFANREMTYDFSIGYSQNESSFTADTLHKDRVELALNGLGGPNCDLSLGDSTLPVEQIIRSTGFAPFSGFLNGVTPDFDFNHSQNISLALTHPGIGQDGCEFLNPFLTRLGDDPALQNSQELLDYVTIRDIKVRDQRTKLLVVDFVMTSELFEFQGNTVQGAVGMQYRKNERRNIASPLNGQSSNLSDEVVPGVFETVVRSADDLYGTSIASFDASQKTTSLFAEISLPIGDNIEMQLAVRYEDIEDLDTSVDPKIAVRWQAHESLAFRGSYSSAIRTPTLGDLNAGSGFDFTAAVDPLKLLTVRNGTIDPQAVLDGGVGAFGTDVIQVFLKNGLPSQDLKPETADTYNFGVIWNPEGVLDGLSVTLDYFRVEYEDAILPQSLATSFAGQIARFQAARDGVGDFAGVNSFVIQDSPLTSCVRGSSADCVVNPLAYQVGNIERLNTDASLAVIRQNQVNIGSVTTDGLDLDATYSWSMDNFGDFSINANATHILQYEIDDGSGVIIDAEGHTNEENQARSLPETKGTLTLGWFKDNHSAALIGRYISSYEDDLSPGSDIASYTTWDMQYNYSFEWQQDASPLNISVGVLDAFDRELDQRASGRGYDTTVFSPQGRRFYLRFQQAFM